MSLLKYIRRKIRAFCVCDVNDTISNTETREMAVEFKLLRNAEVVEQGASLTEPFHYASSPSSLWSRVNESLGIHPTSCKSP